MAALLVGVVMAAAIVLLAWPLLHMLKQTAGRPPVRREALEKKLRADPTAPVVPGLPVDTVTPVKDGRVASHVGSAARQQ
jgi:hypothetical protein